MSYRSCRRLPVVNVVNVVYVWWLSLLLVTTIPAVVVVVVHAQSLSEIQAAATRCLSIVDCRTCRAEPLCRWNRWWWRTTDGGGTTTSSSSNHPCRDQYWIDACAAIPECATQQIEISTTTTSSRSSCDTMGLWEGGIAPNGDGTTTSTTVEQAWLTVYEPTTTTTTTTRPAVIICPGGGYGQLIVEEEGHNVAVWLQSHGIVAFVLEYRLPTRGRSSVPLLDLARAMRIVRSRSREWNVSPSRIGVMGFSAGGHLAATLSTQYTSWKTRPTPASTQTSVDTTTTTTTDGGGGGGGGGISARPDFAILLYPVITMIHDGDTSVVTRNRLLGTSTPPLLLREQWSAEQHVTPTTPPTFLSHATDDIIVPSSNSRIYFDAMCRAGITSSYYLRMAQGGHGFNGNSGPVWQHWQSESLLWMDALWQQSTGGTGASATLTSSNYCGGGGGGGGDASSTTATWIRYAYITRLVVVPEHYLRGYASQWIPDTIVPCTRYSGIDWKRLRLRITLGEYIDYLQPITDLCTTLTSVGAWYYHSYQGVTGPWKAVNGNHSALLGGFFPYATTDDRTWGPFWGAPAGSIGYHAEGGGCCHSTRGSGIIQFWRTLEIDIMIVD